MKTDSPKTPFWTTVSERGHRCRLLRWNSFLGWWKSYRDVPVKYLKQQEKAYIIRTRFGSFSTSFLRVFQTIFRLELKFVRGQFRISFEPGFGAYQGLAQKIEVPFPQDFLLLVAVLRVRGRFQNPRQTPVRTKLRLKLFPTISFCRRATLTVSPHVAFFACSGAFWEHKPCYAGIFALW